MSEGQELEKLTKLVQLKLTKAKIRQGHTPMPLSRVTSLRAELLELLPEQDILQKRQPSLFADGSNVANSLLGKLLAGQRLGLCSLSVDSLDYLEKVMNDVQPTEVVEFGSGVSTIALQVYLQPLRDRGIDTRLISVDQDMDFLKKTRSELKKHGLDKGVQLVHAPVSNRNFNDRQLHCYDLGKLFNALGSARPQLALIDGPFGPPGSRVTVLPEVLGYLAEGAVFLLDDAFRDGEQWVAQVWEQIPSIQLDGIVWVGKGFLQGRVSHAL